MKGNIPDALESFFKAAEIASDHQMMGRLGTISIAIADSYGRIDNYNLALKYYNQSIKILRQEEKDSINLATALLNAGYLYFDYEKLDSALLYYQESGKIFRNLNYPIGVAYNLGNIGQVHAELGNDDIAEINLKQANQLLRDLGDLHPISQYLLYLSDIYLKRGDDATALNYAEQSLELALQFGLKEQISDANLKLSELYEKLGQVEKEIIYYKDHVIYKDSLNSIGALQEIADLQTQFEVAQKQAEVDLLTKEAEIADLQGRRQRWVIFGTALSLIFVAVLAFNSYKRYKYIQKTSQIIKEEKDRSENLLLNILPQETATELKEHGTVKARRIDGVTVLFTDFIGFTQYAEHESPERMVQSIDYYFKQFDEITTKHNLEKIKTIGDSYMCAGGLHSESSQAKDVVEAALEMIDIIDQVKDSETELIHFDMRVGVHTGPVVAGIVGTKKWQYDIWGDTVNIASGMEANSISGKVNISDATYNQVKNAFNVEYRGEIEIKNRGPMKMYFVG
jgi:class 3 adenylate cyclase